MKKALIIGFLFLGVLLAVTSCGSKPIATKTTNTVTNNNREVYNDTVKVIVPEILDSLMLHIPIIKTGNANCDSLANTKLDDILKSFYSYKASSESQLQFYYDDRERMLVAIGKLQQQVNQKISNKEVVNNHTTSEHTEQVPVKYIPKWIQYFALIGAAALAFILYRIIQFIKTKIIQNGK